jgi:hypothetical protein
MGRFEAKRSTIDPGLQQIDAWLKGYTAFNEERLRAWPDGPPLDAKRARVAALGTATVAAMRAEYRAEELSAMNDDARYQTAISRYFIQPEALTADDLPSKSLRRRDFRPIEVPLRLHGTYPA